MVEPLRGEISRRNFLGLIGGFAGSLILPSAYAKGEEHDKVSYAYLTIDDGPSPNMRKILDTIDRYPMNYLTFFLLGKNLKDESNFNLAKEAIQKGHVIGNHSYSHPSFSKLSIEKAKYQIEWTHHKINELYAQTGIENPRLFRFPYGDNGGKKNKKFLADILEANGYTDYFWDGDTLDWKYYNGERSLEKVLSEVGNAKPKDIVLVHDFNRKGRASTPVEAIKVLIEEKGYGLRKLEGKKTKGNEPSTIIEGPVPESHPNLEIEIYRNDFSTIEGPLPEHRPNLEIEIVDRSRLIVNTK